MPFIWNRKDIDVGSDKGMGGDGGDGQNPSAGLQQQGSDGDTEMANAPTSGSAGTNTLMDYVHALLRGIAVTPLNPHPRVVQAGGKMGCDVSVEGCTNATGGASRRVRAREGHYGVAPARPRTSQEARRLAAATLSLDALLGWPLRPSLPARPRQLGTLSA